LNLLLLLLALFLFPVAVYCSILGIINRRLQPLMVSGTWDFLGVLLATSGFLLFVGPALLSGTFRQNLRELPFSRDSAGIGAAVAEIWAAWWVTWLLYYLCVLGGAAALVWARRGTTVIYNVDAATFDTVVLQAARRLGVEVNRLGNRLFLGVTGTPAPLATANHEAATEVMARSPLQTPDPVPIRILAEQVVVDVEVFATLRNVSLYWKNASPEARADLERELGRGLAEVITLDNPVGGWLLGVAGLLFLTIMMLTAFFVMGTIMTARPH
jgi:hypothetical protein